MKFLMWTLSFGVIAILVVGCLIWWKTNTSPPGSDQTIVRFIIPRGYSAEQIGEDLLKKGLIKNSLAFKIYVQVTGRAGKLSAGEYNLSRSQSLTEIIEALDEGPVEVWVVVPEGLRNEEVAEKVALQLEKTDPAFVADFIVKSLEIQGYLFPDTYLFPRDVTAEKVIKIMNDNFKKKISRIEVGLVRPLDDVVKMASIIEREVKNSKERAIVSGILWKRLDSQGWLIQADATVQYALGSANCKPFTGCNWWPVLTKMDLELDSPFNTYKHKSLPPTPISNPGIDSLVAAANPEESDFWYYIHDNQGNIHFAKSLEEHNQNISKYL